MYKNSEIYIESYSGSAQSTISKIQSAKGVYAVKFTKNLYPISKIHHLHRQLHFVYV